MSTSVRPLTAADRAETVDLLATDPVPNAFVAGRIAEGALDRDDDSLLGHREGGRLDGILWASVNVVPASCSPQAIEAFAGRIRRSRSRYASIFGPAEQVRGLWTALEPGWSPVRGIRQHQPLMATARRPSDVGVPVSSAVRRARRDEVDLVLPAAAAMFTDEIGYPPYVGSPAGYRTHLLGLIDHGYTWIWREGDEVLFKADVGSAGLGVAQVQGVWLSPALRGRGLAPALMAAVTESVIDDVAPVASLYVNHFNTAARATYRRIGYRDCGSYATVLL